MRSLFFPGFMELLATSRQEVETHLQSMDHERRNSPSEDLLSDVPRKLSLYLASLSGLSLVWITLYTLELNTSISVAAL